MATIQGNKNKGTTVDWIILAWIVILVLVNSFGCVVFWRFRKWKPIRAKSVVLTIISTLAGNCCLISLFFSNGHCPLPDPEEWCADDMALCDFACGVIGTIPQVMLGITLLFGVMSYRLYRMWLIFVAERKATMQFRIQVRDLGIIMLPSIVSCVGALATKASYFDDQVNECTMYPMIKFNLMLLSFTYFSFYAFWVWVLRGIPSTFNEYRSSRNILLIAFVMATVYLGMIGLKLVEYVQVRFFFTFVLGLLISLNFWIPNHKLVLNVFYHKEEHEKQFLDQMRNRVEYEHSKVDAPGAQHGLMPDEEESKNIDALQSAVRERLHGMHDIVLVGRIVVVTGIVLIALGFLSRPLVATYVDHSVGRFIVASEWSRQWQQFAQNNTKPKDTPIYVSFHLYNVTSEVPWKLTDVGPFVYREYHVKLDPVWTAGGNTIEYTSWVYYIFQSSRSYAADSLKICSCGYPQCRPLQCRSVRDVLFGDKQNSSFDRGWFGVNETSIEAAITLASMAIANESFSYAMPQSYGRSSFGTGKADISDAFVLHSLNGRLYSNVASPKQRIDGSDDAAVGNFTEEFRADHAGQPFSARLWSFLLWQPVSIEHVGLSELKGIKVNQFRYTNASIIPRWSERSVLNGSMLSKYWACGVNVSAQHQTPETVMLSDEYFGDCAHATELNENVGLKQKPSVATSNMYFETFLGLMMSHDQRWQHSILLLPDHSMRKWTAVSSMSPTDMPSSNVTDLPRSNTSSLLPKQPNASLPSNSTMSPTMASGRRLLLQAGQRQGVVLPIFRAQRQISVSDYTADRYRKKVAATQNIPLKFLLVLSSGGIVLISVGIGMVYGTKVFKEEAKKLRDIRANVAKIDTVMTTLHAHVFKKPRVGNAKAQRRDGLRPPMTSADSTRRGLLTPRASSSSAASSIELGSPSKGSRSNSSRMCDVYDQRIDEDSEHFTDLEDAYSGRGAMARQTENLQRLKNESRRNESLRGSSSEIGIC